MAAEILSFFASQVPQLLGLPIDFRISEIHNASADITEVPIEDGSIVSDHIILRPDTVEINARITNEDFGVRASITWNALKLAWQNRQTVDILTRHELYTNMAIENISGNHEAPWTGQLDISARFKRINPIRLQFSEIPETQLLGGVLGVGKSASTLVRAGRLVTQTPSTATLGGLVGSATGFARTLL